MGDFLEKFKLQLSPKDLLSYSMALIAFTGTWFALSAEIQVAKELPKPEVNRVEFELKNRIIQESVLSIEKDIKEIKYMINKLDDKIYEQNKK